MISGAITAAITALLGFLGFEPSVALVGGIFVAVKVSVVGVIALIGMRALRKKQRAEPAAATPSEPPPPPT